MSCWVSISLGSRPMISTRRKLAAEFFGTYILVFAGTGAIVVNQVREGAITHVGIALTFGLIVLALIYALGDISGCHLNPAVTIGFFVAKRFPLECVLPYIASQCCGAIAASGTLRAMFPDATTLGGTLPSDGAMQSFVMEFILTLILMLVILCVSSGAKEKGIMAGVAVGSVIAVEALFAGPVCGASMNPARSIGPAVASLHLQELWIYIAAPILGACIAVFAYRCIQETGQRRRAIDFAAY